MDKHCILTLPTNFRNPQKFPQTMSAGVRLFSCLCNKCEKVRNLQNLKLKVTVRCDNLNCNVMMRNWTKKTLDQSNYCCGGGGGTCYVAMLQGDLQKLTKLSPGSLNVPTFEGLYCLIDLNEWILWFGVVWLMFVGLFWEVVFDIICYLANVVI